MFWVTALTPTDISVSISDELLVDFELAPDAFELEAELVPEAELELEAELLPE